VAEFAEADALYDAVGVRLFRAEFRAAIADLRAAAWDEGYGPDEESGMPRSNPYRSEGQGNG
jgi:hypothetical protein